MSVPALPSAATSPLSDALSALAESRQRLRGAMLPPPESGSGSSSASGGGMLRRLGAMWRHWRRQGRNFPVLQLGMHALQGWWLAQPWRQVSEAVAGPLSGAATPLVRRHPWPAMLLAVAAGAALAAARPWRWALVARQAHSLRRQAVGWTLAQASGPLGQALVASMLAGLAKSAMSTPTPTPAADSPAAQPVSEPVHAASSTAERGDV